MDEQELRDRLFDTATAEQPPVWTLDADLARGRRRRRRRGIAVAGGGLGVLAVASSVTAVGLSAQSGGGPGGVAGQPHGPRVTHAGPTGIAAHPTHVSQPLVTHGMSQLPNGDEGEAPYAPWRNNLYGLAREYLDPTQRFLNYDSDSSFGGSTQTGFSIGIKMGWQSAGDTGEGMVSAEIASPGDANDVACYDFPPCVTVNEPGYGEVRLGGDPSGRDGYEVVLTQADGEIAHVVVSPLFGNNSLTPTQEPLPSLDRVLAFATDEQFDMPTS